MKENVINIENYHTPKEFKKVIDFNLLPLFFFFIINMVSESTTIYLP